MYYIKSTKSSNETESSELASQWAIDLISNKDNTPESLFQRYYIPLTFAVSGTSTAAYMNIRNRKPWYTSVPRLMIHGMIGYLVGTITYYYFRRTVQRQNMHLLDYLKMHPEKFADNRLRYKDLYKLNWMPLR
ncbi:uncharacterized protein LOC117218476 [Megalopta genalis]|uniref:uncharacterized protein LOC117218476 n=1 Tax=Megalopta genalis TaxID=115081 RepID=UPI003FD5146B